MSKLQLIYWRYSTSLFFVYVLLKKDAHCQWQKSRKQQPSLLFILLERVQLRWIFQCCRVIVRTEKRLAFVFFLWHCSLTSAHQHMSLVHSAQSGRCQQLIVPWTSASMQGAQITASTWCLRSLQQAEERLRRARLPSRAQQGFIRCRPCSAQKMTQVQPSQGFRLPLNSGSVTLRAASSVLMYVP